MNSESYLGTCKILLILREISCFLVKFSSGYLISGKNFMLVCCQEKDSSWARIVMKTFTCGYINMCCASGFAIRETR